MHTIGSVHLNAIKPGFDCIQRCLPELLNQVWQLRTAELAWHRVVFLALLRPYLRSQQTPMRPRPV